MYVQVSNIEVRWFRQCNGMINSDLKVTSVAFRQRNACIICLRPPKHQS